MASSGRRSRTVSFSGNTPARSIYRRQMRRGSASGWRDFYRLTRIIPMNLSTRTTWTAGRRRRNRLDQGEPLERTSSSSATKAVMETPIARQKARSSSASIRRSPRSHLEMNDWVVSNLFASCSCVKPCFSLNCRNNSKNLAYSVECIVFGLLMTPRLKKRGFFYSYYWNMPKSNSQK